MQNLIIRNLFPLCEEYRLSNTIYDTISVSLEFDIRETLDIIHDIIFTNIDMKTPEVAYRILQGSTRLYKKPLVDALLKFIKEQKESKSLVTDTEDMYTLLNAMRTLGFSDAIICKHFLDTYLPYKEIVTPFSRDNVVKTRYTSDVIDDVIYINIPSDSKSLLEALNNMHIDLAIEQNNRK